MTNCFYLLTDKQILKSFYRGLQETKKLYYNDLDIDALMKRVIVFRIRYFVDYLAELDTFAYHRDNRTAYHQMKNVHTLAMIWARPRHQRGMWDIGPFTRHLYDLATSPWNSHNYELVRECGHETYREFYNDRVNREVTLGYRTDRHCERFMCNPFIKYDSDISPWNEYDGVYEEREMWERSFWTELDLLCHYHIPAAFDD